MTSQVPVLQRQVGQLDLSLSQISFGSMRLDPRANTADTSAFLCSLFDAGVDTHHSSFEYDSYPHYCEAVRSVRTSGRHPKHIVKLAEPSFDHHEFDAGRFIAAVDRELTALGTESIANVQWMVRTPEPASSTSLGAFHGATEALGAVADELRAAGKIESLSVFPYSAAEAQTTIDSGIADAQCVYLNLLERGDLKHLEQIPTIALRPVSGGALSSRNPFWCTDAGQAVIEEVRSAGELAASTIADVAMSWPLLHSGVSTVVVSLVDDPRLLSTLLAVGQVAPQPERFRKMRAAAERLPHREVLLDKLLG